MYTLLRNSIAALLIITFTAALIAAQESTSKKQGAVDAKKPAAAKKSTADAAQARGEFDRVYGEWKALMAKLAELQTNYNEAPEAEKGTIEKQYAAEVARGEKLAEQLKSATFAAFSADPTDKEVSELLELMAFNAFRQDNYEEVDRFALPLIAQKIKEPQMAWFAANAALALHRFDEVEPLVQKSLSGGAPAPQQQLEAQTLVESASAAAALWPAEQKIREAEAKADDLPRVKLETNKGDITIELFENEAPNTVANFISLVEKKFYDNVIFPRVLAGFMAQTGDPTGTTGGGPGYRIKDEFDRARMHFRGSLSMANSGPDTNGSQFFLTFRPTPHLNGKHTVFGRVIDGFEVLSKIKRVAPDPRTGQPPAGADKIIKATVLRKRDHEYKPETLPEK
jgi:cyclophilin family peptidyl-prolyl cis-trans isomerase